MRLRLAVSLAALALLVILAQSASMLLLLDRKEEELIDNLLSQQIEYSMEVGRKSPQAAFPNTPAMWLYRVDRQGGQDRAHDVPPLFAHLGVGRHEVYLGDKEYHVAVREDEQARYILAYDVGEHESRRDELILITIGAAVGLGLLTLVAGYLLAGRLSRRLERLAERVGDDSAEHLLEPGMDRELHAVAAALDRYRAKQAAMLARERDFAANLSHELRTPLTGIRTDAELLAALPELPEAVARRGNRIIASVDRIDHLASSLLLLARDATPALPEEIRLRDAIAAVWESVHQTQPKTVGLRLDIDPAYTVRADASLLDLVLRNVLDNALRYSADGDIVCRLDGRRLHVRDTGPGFAAADLDRIFERFYVGPRGTNGLGLALVRHVCTACDWSVAAGNIPDGGEIVIDFGESLARAAAPPPSQNQPTHAAPATLRKQ